MNYLYGTHTGAELSELIGKTCVSIVILDTNKGLQFTLDNGEIYTLTHVQDCCECVEIVDITGDLKDLVGSPILLADESSNKNTVEYGSETWTFYKFATIKGYVDIRWLGESNGYYSESVDFVKAVGK